MIHEKFGGKLRAVCFKGKRLRPQLHYSRYIFMGFFFIPWCSKNSPYSSNIIFKWCNNNGAQAGGGISAINDNLKR